MTTGSMTSSRKPRMKSSSRLASISASSSSALASDFMSSGNRRRTFLIGAGMLRGEACEPVELGLRQLAIVGDDHEMILHQAEHLDGKPQPLARIGVARRGVTPALDVIGLDLREDVFERLAAEQLLGARAARNCRLELVIDHLSLSASCAGRSASSRAFTPVHSPRRRRTRPLGRLWTRVDALMTRASIAKKFSRTRWTAGSSPAVTIICRGCFSETGGILVSYCAGCGAAAWAASAIVLMAERCMSCWWRSRRDLQVEELELLLERELLAFEGE